MHIQQAKSILSSQNGMNLYRGCTHGCIYCDSRSDCYQIPQPFEDVGAKVNAPELLEAALKKKRQRCMIGTGAMGDPWSYPPMSQGDSSIRIWSCHPNEIMPYPKRFRTPAGNQPKGKMCGANDPYHL